MKEDMKRIGKKIWQTLCKIWKGFIVMMTAIPKVWKIVVILIGITIVDIIVVRGIWWWQEEMQIYTILKAIILLPVVVFTAWSIWKLQQGINALSEGDYNYKIDTAYMPTGLKQQGEALNCIGEGMTLAIDQKMRSERMKVELITNVSHDIKTPLTSIINYADLIGKEECDNEKIKEYSEVLHRQSERLKRLIDDLIEASKASTGNLDVVLEPCEVNVLLTQVAGEYEQRLQEKMLELRMAQLEKRIQIMADGRRIWRVIDNLMGNICKYGQPGTRVYLSLEEKNGKAVLTFRNISKEELNLSEEELMERFVQGDSARKAEGNGLGLSIARSLTELQNGTMEIVVDGDLFKVVLRFPEI